MTARAESKAGMHLGNSVNGMVKALCGRRRVRGWMTPEVFVELSREKRFRHERTICGNCREIGTRLYLPRPKPEPERSDAPRLF